VAVAVLAAAAAVLVLVVAVDAAGTVSAAGSVVDAVRAGEADV
jgi:hypothetical protein